MDDVDVEAALGLLRALGDDDGAEGETNDDNGWRRRKGGGKRGRGGGSTLSERGQRHKCRDRQGRSVTDTLTKKGPPRPPLDPRRELSTELRGENALLHIFMLNPIYMNRKELSFSTKAALGWRLRGTMTTHSPPQPPHSRGGRGRPVCAKCGTEEWASERHIPQVFRGFTMCTLTHPSSFSSIPCLTKSNYVTDAYWCLHLCT
jgi:hypothetical protein